MPENGKRIVVWICQGCDIAESLGDEFAEQIQHIGMNPFKGLPTFGFGGGI